MGASGGQQNAGFPAGTDQSPVSPGIADPGQQPALQPGYRAGYGMAPVTADGVVLAGWWSRVFASLIDGFLLMPVTLVTLWLQWDSIEPGLQSYLVLAAAGGQPDILDPSLGLRVPYAITIVISSLALLVYGTLMLGNSGATLGQKAVGIRVVPVDQGRYNGGLSLNKALIRQLAYVVLNSFTIVFLFNGLMPLMNQRRQALHDMIAGTQVVKGLGD